MLCLVALGLLNGCATDAYTGESKVAKTAWGTGIGRSEEHTSELQSR